MREPDIQCDWANTSNKCREQAYVVLAANGLRQTLCGEHSVNLIELCKRDGRGFKSALLLRDARVAAAVISALTGAAPLVSDPKRFASLLCAGRTDAAALEVARDLAEQMGLDRPEAWPRVGVAWPQGVVHQHVWRPVAGTMRGWVDRSSGEPVTRRQPIGRCTCGLDEPFGG